MPFTFRGKTDNLILSRSHEKDPFVVLLFFNSYVKIKEFFINKRIKFLIKCCPECSGADY